MQISAADKRALWQLFDEVANDFWNSPQGRSVSADLQVDRLLKSRERAVLEFMYREEFMKLLRVSVNVTEAAFLTLNPPNDKTLEDLITVVDRLVGILPGAYLYAYEATANADRCPHVHILFHHKLVGSKWSNFLKRIQRICVELLNVKDERFFDLKHIEANEVEKVIKYILKTNPPKNGDERAKREATTSLRESNRLEEYYSNYEDAVLDQILSPQDNAIAD